MLYPISRSITKGSLFHNKHKINDENHWESLRISRKYHFMNFHLFQYNIFSKLRWKPPRIWITSVLSCETHVDVFQTQTYCFWPTFNFKLRITKIYVLRPYHWIHYVPFGFQYVRLIWHRHWEQEALFGVSFGSLFKVDESPNVKFFTDFSDEDPWFVVFQVLVILFVLSFFIKQNHVSALDGVFIVNLLTVVGNKKIFKFFPHRGKFDWVWFFAVFDWKQFRVPEESYDHRFGVFSIWLIRLGVFVRFLVRL